jgi:hypothetical protein
MNAKHVDCIPDRMHALLARRGACLLSEESSAGCLSLPVAPFEAVQTFGKPAKPPHVGVHMPPVHEQLQIAANHFASAAVVVWVASPAGKCGGEELEVFPGLEPQDAVQDLPWLGERSFAWGILILTKQVRAKLHQSIVPHNALFC